MLTCHHNFKSLPQTFTMPSVLHKIRSLPIICERSRKPLSQAEFTFHADRLHDILEVVVEDAHNRRILKHPAERFHFPNYYALS